MNRLESWLMHVSTIALALTGAIYAWMRYLMKPEDPFSVVNHPLEPYMLSAHILIAPLLLLGFGIILHSHILFKVVTGSRTARKTGLILIPTFGVMVISGYLLQVITSDFRKALVVIHLGSGLLWSILYLGHQVASLSQRRARSNLRSGSRYPVQAVFLALFIALSCDSYAAPFERQVYSMGTTLRVVSLEMDHAKALQDSEALIRVIEEADNQLSTWKSTSELSRLNGTAVGQAVSVSRDLFVLLEQVKRWTVMTNGSFDPGIGRLIDVWGVHGNFRIPSGEEISSALSVSGVRYLSMDAENLTVTKLKDVLIDPGAFGKGEALDRALRLATSRNMAPVLMDFGGQIAVHRVPKKQEGWSAGFAKPQDRSKMEKVKLWIKAGSLSTSGYSERSGKVGDRPIHHILDPATGLPVESFGSVTVWHSKALVADVLSTGLYVMGADSGFQWAVKNNVAAAFIVNQKVRKTPEFERLFQ